MKLLPLLAVLLSVGIAGCSDPHAKYRDAQLTVGMTIAEIKQQFGEPDSFIAPDGNEQMLRYGAFGAHDQKRGHVTRYRLSLTFVDGKLIDWDKSTPINGE